MPLHGNRSDELAIELRLPPYLIEAIDHFIDRDKSGLSRADALIMLIKSALTESGVLGPWHEH